jgi:hypothetical protein
MIVVATLLLLALGTNAMAQADEDTSMKLFRFTGLQMATRELALVMAETIFKNVYGEDNFKTQEPLQIIDSGDRWIVEGSRRPEDYPAPPGEAANGKTRIVILKINCQVVSLNQFAQLPPPSE